MATKTVVTRIKNKVDTLAKWQAYTGTLLDGEIAVVRVPTGETYTNPVTGADEPVVELLMKVGDGSTTFANLPWMSAKASDVYDWGKAKTVEFNTSTYKVEFKDASGNAILAVDLTSIDARLDALESKKITVTPNDSSKPGVVQSVTQGDASHEIDVTYGLIETADITDAAVTTDKIKDANVTTAKIANSAVSTDKIANGAVTDAKVSAGISSDKINVGTSIADGTLSAKLAEIDAGIAGKAASSHKHGNITNSGTITSTAVTAATGVLVYDSSNKIQRATAANARSIIGAAESGHTHDNRYVRHDASQSLTADQQTQARENIDAASNTAVFGTDGLKSKVDKNTADITALTESVSKGVNFRGEVASAPSGASYTLKNTSTAVTAIVGDMVICGEKEYIYTAASTWKELGDLGRVTTLETWRNKLQKADTAVTNQFVTEVDIAADGTVTVNRAQPTSANVSHDGSTVKVALENLAGNKANASDVYTKTETGTQISNAVAALVVDEPTASGTSTSFIATAKQTDGKIIVTKKNLPTATAGAEGAAGTKGIVALIDSTSSTSTAAAATPNSVKTAYDLASKAEADAAAALNAANHDHSPYINQNAFSKIAVSGKTTVEADSATDTVTFAGSNVTITTDATNNKITFSVAKADADGETGIVTLEDSIVNQSTTAATSKAVYSVNTKATDAQARVGAVEANYVRVGTGDKLVQYVSGTENEIILDCGGAE